MVCIRKNGTNSYDVISTRNFMKTCRISNESICNVLAPNSIDVFAGSYVLWRVTVFAYVMCYLIRVQKVSGRLDECAAIRVVCFSGGSTGKTHQSNCRLMVCVKGTDDIFFNKKGYVQKVSGATEDGITSGVSYTPGFSTGEGLFRRFT